MDLILLLSEYSVFHLSCWIEFPKVDFLIIFRPLMLISMHNNEVYICIEVEGLLFRILFYLRFFARFRTTHKISFQIDLN